MVASRSCETTLIDWEIIRGIKFDDTPKAEQHRQIIETKTSSMIPFFDVCNHISTKNIRFFLVSADKEIMFATQGSYQQGEEVEYSYNQSTGNDRLVFTYGFFGEDNPFTKITLIVTLYRRNYIEEKHKLCSELQCLEGNQNLDHFFNTRMDSAQVIFNPIKNKLKAGNLNMLRMYIYPNDKFINEKEDILFKLKNGEMLDYDNEIRTLTLYKEFLKYHLVHMKIDFVITIF
jgi:hypothetical protein